MASSLDPGKMHHSVMGLYSGSNQHVNKSGLEEVPIHGAEMFNEVMNLLNLNGMNYSKLMTKLAFLYPFTFSSTIYDLAIPVSVKLLMLDEVDEILGSDYARVPTSEPFSAKFITFFAEVFTENSGIEGEEEDDKKTSPGHAAQSNRISQKKDGSFVVPPIIAAGTLTTEEIAVKTKVEEHLNYVMILLSKLYEKLGNLAAKTGKDESKFVFWYPDEPPRGGAGEAHFGAVNMAAYILGETIKVYNNGMTEDQVRYEIMQDMTNLTWDGESPLALFFRKYNHSASSLVHLGTAPDASEMIVMTVSIFNKGAKDGNENQALVAQVVQEKFDKMTEGEKLADPNLKIFQRSITSDPRVAKMNVGTPKSGKVPKQPPKVPKGQNGPGALSNVADGGKGHGKGTGKGTGKSRRKPDRKSDKPTRGGGGGGGGGDDSSVDTYDKGCFRCGEGHAVRDCPHSAEDARKAFKAFRGLKDHSGHKSNVGKAAETDSDSESDDDDQDDEDEKEIQIALASIEMRMSMKKAGHSKKAIDRRIKKFKEDAYTK